MKEAEIEIKAILKKLLIEEPPKRVDGNSNWVYNLKVRLFEFGCIEGKKIICDCLKDNFCNEEPCVNYLIPDEELLRLIDNIKIS